MNVRAVFVDFGGVIMRTEDKGPRTHLAKRLGMPEKDVQPYSRSLARHLRSIVWL